jgi:hypothetical protein
VAGGDKPDVPTDRQLLARALVALESAVAGLREQATTAEQRAHRAEATRDEANSRAEALRELLGATQLELAEQRELTDRADAAREGAVRAAEELRQARGLRAIRPCTCRPMRSGGKVRMAPRAFDNRRDWCARPTSGHACLRLDSPPHTVGPSRPDRRRAFLYPARRWSRRS